MNRVSAPTDTAFTRSLNGYDLSIGFHGSRRVVPFAGILFTTPYRKSPSVGEGIAPIMERPCGQDSKRASPTQSILSDRHSRINPSVHLRGTAQIAMIAKIPPRHPMTNHPPALLPFSLATNAHNAPHSTQITTKYMFPPCGNTSSILACSSPSLHLQPATQQQNT